MKNILEYTPVKEYIRNISNMYRLGYDERNGGNVSMILNKEELKEYLDFKVIREIPLNFDAKELEGEVFIVTGTGKYFKNVEYDPEKNLGIVRIKKGGSAAELLWGFSDGGKFTSEFPAHLMSHIERRKVNPNNKVVMHCHPANIIAMTITHNLDEKEFTKTIWRTNTECIVVFPEGLGVLPWELCGTSKIGQDTALKMREFRVVIWAIHGVFAVGETLDEAFGLIETVEKTCEIYNLCNGKEILNTITDEQLYSLAKFWNLETLVKPGWLDVK